MSRIWDQLQLLQPGWGDLVEIAIVAVLFYRFLILLQRTRAMQMLTGAFLLVGIYFVARLLDFALIRYLLETLFQYGAIAALVVFQPELRSALARLGRNRFGRFLRSMDDGQSLDELVDAVMELARLKRGAIIAIQGEVGLEEYADTGSAVNAPVSAEMLKTIFTPYTPLHDGAVIINGGNILTAGAILPLTQLPVVVVSEETSRISVARGGRIEVGIDENRLREILTGPTSPEGKGAK